LTFIYANKLDRGGLKRLPYLKTLTISQNSEPQHRNIQYVNTIDSF